MLLLLSNSMVVILNTVDKVSQGRLYMSEIIQFSVQLLSTQQIKLSVICSQNKKEKFRESQINYDDVGTIK